MTNKIKLWELIYKFIDSSFNAILWAIPLVVSIIATSAYFVYRFIDLFVLIVAIIFLFIIAGLFQLYISKNIESLKIVINETIEMLKEDRNNKIDEVSKRNARSYPDDGKVALGEYNKLIQSIHKNGYYDFECSALDQIDPTNPVLLFMVFPGMFKIYLVGGQYFSSDIKAIFRIHNPNDVDLRDFAKTWFEHIFRILGNTCKGISELQSGSRSPGKELSGDFYVISKYKVFKKNKNYIFRVYID